MITHSVNMFRNCSVVHDLSTSNDYSTILYKFVSMWWYSLSQQGDIV